MKWVSHEIVTGMAVYTMTGEPVLTVCAMAGAVLPDWIEGKGGGMRLPWAGWLAHRGWSHWPLLYVLVFLALGVWGDETGEASDLARVGRFIAVGNCREQLGQVASAWQRFREAAQTLPVDDPRAAVAKQRASALAGKVPLLHPARKVGVRLFRVGSFGEYIVALILVLAIYAFGRLFLWQGATFIR